MSECYVCAAKFERSAKIGIPYCVGCTPEPKASVPMQEVAANSVAAKGLIGKAARRFQVSHRGPGGIFGTPMGEYDEQDLRKLLWSGMESYILGVSGNAPAHNGHGNVFWDEVNVPAKPRAALTPVLDPFPLIANEIVEVCPMELPSGLIFYLDYVYGKHTHQTSTGPTAPPIEIMETM